MAKSSEAAHGYTVGAAVVDLALHSLLEAAGVERHGHNLQAGAAM